MFGRRSEEPDPTEAYDRAMDIYLQMSRIPGADLGKLQRARISVIRLAEVVAESVQRNKRRNRLGIFLVFLALVIAAVQAATSQTQWDFVVFVLGLIPLIAIWVFTKGPPIIIDSPHEDRLLRIAWEDWGSNHFLEARRQTVDGIARYIPPFEGESRDAHRRRVWLTRNTWRRDPSGRTLAERIVTASMASVPRPPAQSASPSTAPKSKRSRGRPRKSSQSG
jgi:hypothetical protein